ncbi:MAG: amidohydrolase family protein [Bacteroidota bacterium]
MKRLFLLLVLVGLTDAMAQETFPRNDVRDLRSGAVALINATLQSNAATRTEGATVLIRDGRIEKTGKGLAVPAGYTQIDLKGKFVYPSFIDLHSNYGLPKADAPQGGGGFGGPEQFQSKTKGAYSPNQAIKAEYDATREFTIDSKTAEKWRSAGFGAVLTFRADGIARGTSAVVSLAETRDQSVIIRDRAAAHLSFNRGTSRQLYPSSLMGSIALLRQTYLDAEWYGKQNPKPFRDLSLEGWIASQQLPQVFEANGWINLLRADKVGDEFGKQYIIRGTGDEYQRLQEVRATKAPLIIPVSFPDAFDVEDPFDASQVSLTDMKHWEMAPANAAMLEKAGVEFAITSDRLKDRADLLKNVRKAIEYGLSETAALKALTEVPAKLMNVQNRIGSVAPGMDASFLITSASIFAEDVVIHENWVQGNRYVLKDLDAPDHAGNYAMKVSNNSYTLEVTGKAGSQKFKVRINDSTTVDARSKAEENLITLGFTTGKDKSAESYRLSGWKTADGWAGKGQRANGDWVDWSATATGAAAQKSEAGRGAGKKTSPEIGNVIYPFTAFGQKEKPVAEEMLIRNATVWTNESAGKLENTDVLIRDGKIAAVGKNLPASGKVIDGTGKHLTAGIIDEHSHIALAAINDATTNSAMVREEDVVNSEDNSIYQQLAGGVVAAQLLHGSANPIGGQSALIKLKWGASPEELKISGADKFIKFALGENVKRSSSAQSTRFPQTRMGVEQVYVDAFTNAIEYEKKWKNWQSLPEKTRAVTAPPRRDLVDETILEIIRGKRWITCHSYVQSEINMMMKVAERFGVRINSLTHIMEGYKVADKMRQHGVAAGTFSDWWNYKWEVHYAIPYNAAIMQREGVLTAINSDDANMGRRLNQEAAKAVKYGDISEEDALKMVTLNPARILHLDKQMGTVSVGKSADVVLWNAHPLSVYARAEKTIIEGAVYYDLARDLQLRDELRGERARIIRKMLDAKKSGGPVQRPASGQHLYFDCDGDQETITSGN